MQAIPRHMARELLLDLVTFSAAEEISHFLYCTTVVFLGGRGCGPHQMTDSWVCMPHTSTGQNCEIIFLKNAQCII